MRNSILNRYILKEFLPPFGVGLLVFTFVLVLNNLFLMMDLFLNRGVSIGMILTMAFLVLPMFLPLSIPMASLLAALISYGRLSEDGEITALRSSGCSLAQYSFPNLFFGLVLSFFLIYFNCSIAPKAAFRFKDLYYAMAQQNPLALFAPKVMNHFGEFKIIVDKMDRRKKKISGISIYKMNPNGSPTRILAPEGELNSFPGEGITLELLNGSIHQPNSEKGNEYTITKFNRFALKVPAKSEMETRAVTPREMTYNEIKKQIGKTMETASLRTGGGVPKGQSLPAKESLQMRDEVSLSSLRTENHLRIAIAFAPVVFVLFGITFGSQVKKGSRSIGIGISIVAILIYYGLFMFVISLSSQGFGPPLVLTWIPNILVLAAGLFLWTKLARY